MKWERTIILQIFLPNRNHVTPTTRLHMMSLSTTNTVSPEDDINRCEETIRKGMTMGRSIKGSGGYILISSDPLFGLLFLQLSKTKMSQANRVRLFHSRTHAFEVNPKKIILLTYCEFLIISLIQNHEEKLTKFFLNFSTAIKNCLS